MRHGARRAGPPRRGAGSVKAPRAVGKRQLEHPAERALAPHEAVVPGRRHDLVAPPAGGHLGGQRVDLAGLGLEERSDN